MALLLWVLLGGTGRTDAQGNGIARVKRTTMTVTVTGPGRIRAADAVNIDVPRKTQGDLQLIYLIEEGIVVEKGQIVAQLDTTAAVERLETALDQLETAEASFDQLLEDHKDLIKNLENAVRSAELAYAQAELRLKSLEFSSELEKRQGALDLEKARISRDESKRKLEAQKVINEAERRQEEINLEGRRREVQGVREELEALTLRAPISGLVIHAEQGRFLDRTKVREGDTVRRGQRILSLPDLSELQAVVTVNELDAERVKVGQRAIVRLESYPREAFMGRVTELSTLAQQTRDSGNVRVFPAIVTLDEPDPRIRPGMTASAEIIVEELQDVLTIPLSACVVESGRSLVKMVGADEPVEVKLGLRTESVAQVISGLKEGDEIEIGWQENPAGVLVALAGYRPLPEETARSIVAQGERYGEAPITSSAAGTVQESLARGTPPPAGRSGGRGGMGGMGGMGGEGGVGGDRTRRIDPSQMTPEMRARFETMRNAAASGEPRRGDSGEPRMGASGEPRSGQAGGFFTRMMPDSTQRARFFGDLSKRAAGLPDTLRGQLEEFILSEGATFRKLSPALRDSLRAWGAFRNRGRARTVPPGRGTPPPPAAQPTGSGR